jgi:hypothetical protein
MAPGGANLTVGPSWSPVLARLDAIEARLQEIAPFLEAFAAEYRERTRMGHNNPRLGGEKLARSRG